MTAAALLATWRTRDNRYSLRKHPLTPAEYQAVIAYRRSELLELRPAERGKAGVALSLWTPRTDLE
jgi:hypothetical protein